MRVERFVASQQIESPTFVCVAERSATFGALQPSLSARVAKLEGAAAESKAKMKEVSAKAREDALETGRLKQVGLCVTFRPWQGCPPGKHLHSLHGPVCRSVKLCPKADKGAKAQSRLRG